MGLIQRIQDGGLGEYAAEMIFFGFKVAEAMLDPTIRLHIYQAVCKQEYSNEASCYSLQESPEIEEQVQNEAATYNIAYKILLNAPVVFLGLFCGAWSDRTGRKLPVVLACLGSIFAVLMFMLSLLESVPTMPLVLFGSALRGMFGKSAVVTMALHSYISDITGKNSRTQRLGGLLGMNFFGYFVGSLLAGVILETNLFNIVFCVVIAIYALCVFVALVCMRESLQDESITGSVFPALTNPFSFKHIRESLDVAIRPRKDNERIYLWFFFLCIIAHQTCKSGEVDITLLYTKRAPLNWSKSLYGYFLAVDYAALGVSVIGILPILIYFAKLKDLTIVTIGFLFKVIRLSILTFTNQTGMIFLSVVIGCPSGFIPSGVKSLVSKTVSDDEIGKVFSLLSCFETASNLAGSIIFNGVYKGTAYSVFPGFAFAVDAVFQLMLLVSTVGIGHDMGLCAKYEPIDNNTDAITTLYGSTDTKIPESDEELKAEKGAEKCPMSFENKVYEKSLEEGTNIETKTESIEDTKPKDKFEMFKEVVEEEEEEDVNHET